MQRWHTPTKLLSQNTFKESTGGRVGGGDGGQGRCEQRSEVFVKIQKKKFFFFFFLGGGGQAGGMFGGGGHRVDVNKELKFL